MTPSIGSDYFLNNTVIDVFDNSNHFIAQSEGFCELFGLYTSICVTKTLFDVDASFERCELTP